MSLRRLAAVFAPAALLGAAFVAGGCEDTVNPFLDEPRHFTVYGFLSTDADTQVLRVEAVRRTVDLPQPGPLDAVVTTTDLTTGAVTTWRDSLVAFRDGTRGHVFFAAMRPAFDRQYRLTITRSDGATTTATTRLPARVAPQIAREPAVSEAGNGSAEHAVTFSGVTETPRQVAVTYRFAPARADFPFRDVRLVYEDVDDGERAGDGWRVRVRYSRDLDTLGRIFGGNLPPLLAVGVRLAQGDAAWVPPGGTFDFDTLIEPTALTNVENGFGFFGSVSMQRAEWGLSRALTAALGFPLP